MAYPVAAGAPSLMLLALWLFHLLLASLPLLCHCCCWRGFPAVIGIPAVADIPVAGIPAVAGISTHDESLLMMASLLTMVSLLLLAFLLFSVADPGWLYRILALSFPMPDSGSMVKEIPDPGSRPASKNLIFL